MCKQISLKDAVRVLMHVSMLAILLGIASLLWAAESPAYAAYDFVDPTDVVNNRDYTEVILIDSKPGYAQTHVNLQDADRSEDGNIYVRYEKNACPYQTLKLELQGEMPSAWNYMRVEVVQIVDHEEEYGQYFDLGYQGEDKKLEIPTGMFNYADTVLWIQPFFNRDDDWHYIGDVTLKISVEPTKALGNCEVTLDKEVYGYDEVPVPTVTWFGTELVEGRDYEIAYTTNWDNDTKAIVLRGLGDFKLDEDSDYYSYEIDSKEVPYKISWDSGDEDDPWDEDDEDYESVKVSVAGKPVVTEIWPAGGGDSSYRISDSLPKGMQVKYETAGTDQFGNDIGLCTMTMTDCTIDAGGLIPVEYEYTAASYIECSDCDLNLKLKGNNVLKGATNEDLYGFYASGNYGASVGRINVSGGGSLKIDLSGGEYCFGIRAANQINIDGCSLDIVGGERASKYMFYGMTLIPWDNMKEGLSDSRIFIKDSTVKISNTGDKATNVGIDSQDADMKIQNSNIQIDLNSGDALGLAAGLYSSQDDKVYGGGMTIDPASHITIRILNKVASSDTLPTMYFFGDNISSPYIYTGNPGTAAKKVTKSGAFKKNEDRFECSTAFLEFAPTEQSHDDPVIPGIVKKPNPMTAKAKVKTLTAYAKKNTTIKASKAFTVKNNVGAVTYKKTKGDKKISVAKNGKITVKKGLKKGRTYTVKVKVTAAGDAYYKSGSKTVSLKIKIK